MKGKLTIIKGENEGISIILRSDRKITIGRSKYCKFPLKDTKISSVHCQVKLENNKFWLKDLKSKNGTFLNKEQVKKEELKDQDKISLGKTTILFEILQSENVEDKVVVPEITQILDSEEENGQDKNVKMIDKYKILAEVKQRNSVNIYKAEHSIHKNIVTLKVYHWNNTITDEQKEILNKALNDYKNLRNQGIITLYDYFWKEDQLILVMEYIEGRNLQELIAQKKILAPRKALKIVMNVAASINYLNKKNYNHGGLSYLNIFVEKGTRHIKTTDLFLFELFSKCNLDFEEYPPFLPPEFLSNDTYVLGYILIYLLTGKLVYKGNNIGDIIDNLSSKVPEIIKRSLHKVIVTKELNSARSFYKELMQILEKL